MFSPARSLSRPALPGISGALLRAFACLLLATASVGAHAQSANLVGFWWKPSESGWGVSIQQQGARTFAVWLTYDAQAKPVWYTLDCAFSGNTCAGDLITGSGTPLSQITGPANVTPSKVGTGSITTTAL